MKVRIPIYAFLAGCNVMYSMWCYMNAKYYGGTTGLLLAIWIVILVVIGLKDSKSQVIVNTNPEIRVDIKPEL